MRSFRAKAGSALLALTMVVTLSACKQEANTEGNPEVGAATGATIAGGAAPINEGKFNPDTTVVPDPEGRHQQMVPTVPEGHRNLEQDQFMANCRTSCKSEKEGMQAAFCDFYCGCTYQQMDSRVPIGDLRAFARGEQNQSTAMINDIIQKCAVKARNELHDSPQQQQTSKTQTQTKTKG